jgi:hypothetical protein
MIFIRRRTDFNSAQVSPAVAEHGHELFKVADVPGWQEYGFPEVRNLQRDSR